MIGLLQEIKEKMNVWTKLKLSRREKHYVTACVVVVTILLVVKFVCLPIFEKKENAKRSIEVNEKALKEIVALSAEYKKIKEDSADISAVLSRRPEDFALFSFLEKQAGRTGVKSNIKYMKPSTLSDLGSYKESSVEMQLEMITLNQLVEYLYFVESPRNMVRLKRISIKQSKSNAQYLTVLMQVMTYE